MAALPSLPMPTHAFAFETIASQGQPLSSASKTFNDALRA